MRVEPPILGLAHEWWSLEDPEENRTWLFDLTFLTSSWTCIWGGGCPGIRDVPEPERMLGCCSYGAHFSEKSDRKRVAERAEMLGPELWQFAETAQQLGGPIERNDEGEWVTRIVDDACIFLNRPGFPGGAGCALHLAALRAGDPPAEWKPEVCWQMPIRYEEIVDASAHLLVIVRGWRRRDWGEGGADFHWWCVEDRGAYVSDQPVYVSMKDELTRLVGARVYEQLVRRIEEINSVPLPSLKRRGGATDRWDEP